MKKLFYILCGLFICIATNAQNVTMQDKYDKVVALYNNGDFNACQTAAKALVKETDGLLKTNTYRLLALCRLAQDDVSGARSYVDLMLKTDPYFTYQLTDPQRFKDLIDENKNQESGITTASRQAESIDEAPVPVTVISEDMIQHSGASTLQELLSLYVPGMTVAEGCETNISMHGIYSTMQDKVLIMVDGHRLNSSSTNGEALDYRTSLDKIQQIEVLRGPASSLYGNVALTAVVNIITRKGAQMNGGRLTAQVGTQNTYGGSFIVGGGNNVVDIMGWGSIFYSKGFETTVDNGLTGAAAGTTTLYSHGFRGRPAYDIGIKGRWKDFTMSVNLQRSKRVPYQNIIQVPSNQTLKTAENGEAMYDGYRNYNYDKYESIDGDDPGVTRTNNSINLDYSHSLSDNFDIQASGFMSFENTTIYNALGDSVNNTLYPTPLKGMGYASTASLLTAILAQTSDDAGVQGLIFQNLIWQILNNGAYSTKGALEKLDWSGITYGLQAQGSYKYSLGNLGSGSLIFGAQYEQFTLSSSNFLFGGNYTAAGAVSSSAVFKEGDESSISGYMQLKQYLMSDRLILNAGLRYDHKSRFNGEKIDKFSPRFSIIWKLTDKFSLRGCYNYSFVDAPYIYRASILKIFGGGSSMKPETMHSFNAGATYYDRKNHITAEVGCFYNILDNLSTLNTSIASVKSYTLDPSSPWQVKDVVLEYDYLFKNAGKVRSIGFDASVQYSLPRFFGNFNATWQRVMTSENYQVYNSQTFSTPEFHANATAAWSPYQGKGSGFFGSGKLWVRGTLQFQTATYYHVTDLMTTVLSAMNTKDVISTVINRVAPQFNIGLGVGYSLKHFDIDLTLKNLLDNTYYVGSMLMDGTPRAGRQFLAKVTWKF